MRRLVIRPNTGVPGVDPVVKYGIFLEQNRAFTPLQLAGFSYFGEIGGHRHIEGDVPVLYPDRNSPEWTGVIRSDSAKPVRATYAQWLALLAEKKVNLVRVWVFDVNEADSYPFFHHFNAEQYNLQLPSSRYLRRLVRFINIARKHGIVVHLTLASDQMMRPDPWSRTPFHPAHALPNPSGGEYFSSDGFASFLGISGSAEADARRGIQERMVRSLAQAVKPYWNVMFELMNEAGVRPQATVALLKPWHVAVATWLNEELTGDDGNRTHLITVSPVPEKSAAILSALYAGSEQLFDVVSLHGNSWGGPDGKPDNGVPDVRPSGIEEIKASTRAQVKALYDRHPNRPFAVICDSDSFPWAQENPRLYAASALQMGLSYAHRWHENFITQSQLLQQLSGLSASIPAGHQHADTTPGPAIPTVTHDESAVAGRWVQRPGVAATDIGAFRRDSVWVVSNTRTHGGFTIHRWNGTAWSSVDGGAVRIAVGPDGLPWVVNDNNQIYRRTGAGTWVHVPGAARDIGVGADGSVWIIGTTPAFGGFEILRRVNNAWVKVDGGGVRITVNPVGEPWVVNDANQVYARDGERWINTGATGVDIAVGLDDTCWFLGTNAVHGGTGVNYWLSTHARSIDGGGTSIAVDHDGLPWVTNSFSAVYQRSAPE